MTTIVCYDPQGQPVPVAESALTYRLAAYGIFTENNEILLLHDTETDWFAWPGAVLAVGERPLQVVSRAYHQLTGVVPRVGPLVLMEDLYQIDGDGRAWHLSAMYYWLERPSATSISLMALNNNLRPRLVQASDVNINQLKFGRQALQLALRRIKTA